MNESTPLTRRAALLGIGGLAAAGFGLRDATAAPRVLCILTPEQTEGPYYIAGEKIRRNITDGHRGTPLALALGVVDASTCKPIKGALVDIWHADAAGVYSGFGSGVSSRTFMRGIQKADAKGVACFDTVYPGWYPGRTVHIHVKVHTGGTVVHTGQLYFDDTLTDKVFQAAPYSSRPNRDTRNANDMVFFNGGKSSLLKVSKSGAGYLGAITMGVHRS